MYYYLIGSLKRRLVLELQDSFARHPIYSKIVPFIQNKYAFDERPRFGIVIKGSGANKVQLAADNFMGVVESHVMLAYVGQPAYPIEWVREDLALVQQHNDVFPSAPGVYYLEILTVPTNVSEKGTFVIDPLLTVTDEPLVKSVYGEHEAQLQHIPVKNTVRLWEGGRILLYEGKDYEVDYSNGAVTFKYDPPAGCGIVADYRYAVPSIGPIEFQWNTSDYKTLPGVILAFGKRARVGDKVAVVIYKDRVDTANAYGGKFEVSFDFDVIATDPNQMEEIADLVVMYLWGEKKAALEFEGIEIIDTSIGGESEEAYDETGDLYYYTASLGLQLRADWELHMPLPLTISRVTASTNQETLAMPPGVSGPSHLKQVMTGLFFQTAPAIVGRNNAFERIG